MQDITARVTLNVNSAAFSGKDLELMEPEWEIYDRYNYKCVREFRSSYNGPGSWFIEITLGGVGFCVAKLAEAYLNELGKDLYKWSKECLKPVFEKNQKGDGYITFSYHNKKLYLYIEYPGSEKFRKIWKEFPQIIKLIQTNPWRTKIECYARWDKKSKRWAIGLLEVEEKIKIKNVLHRIKWFLIHVYQRFPHDNYMIASFIISFLLSSIFYLLIYIIFLK